MSPQVFPKVQVKMNQSIAGLGDPDQAALDRKYAKITSRMEAAAAKKNVTLKPGTIQRVIDYQKVRDRYGAVCRGFNSDFGFKSGAEVSIPAGVAAKWEAAGICSIVAPN